DELPEGPFREGRGQFDEDPKSGVADAGLDRRPVAVCPHYDPGQTFRKGGFGRGRARGALGFGIADRRIEGSVDGGKSPFGSCGPLADVAAVSESYQQCTEIFSGWQVSRG